MEVFRHERKTFSGEQAAAEQAASKTPVGQSLFELGESPIQLSGEGDNKLNYKRRSPTIDSFRAGLLRPILLDSTKLGEADYENKTIGFRDGCWNWTADSSSI